MVLEGHPRSHWWSGSQRECQTDLWRCTHPPGSLPFFMRGGAAPLHDSLVAKSYACLLRSMCHEPSEGRFSRGSKRYSSEPAAEAQDIESSSSKQMLQMGLRLPRVAGPAKPTAPDGLAVGGFYAYSRGIALGELRRLFAVPRRSQRAFFLGQMQGERP